MFSPREIIATLNHHQVQYIVIGGFAATLHGCPEQTFDLDILYADSPDNRQRLLAALQSLNAQWDESLTESVLQRQPVFALNTRLGDLDILCELLGVGSYDDAIGHSQHVRLGDQKVPLLDLPTLIKSKEAAADPNPRKQAALDYLRKLLPR